MINSIGNNLLWSHGWAIIVVLIALALIGFNFFRPLLYLSIVLFAFSLFFFRNPDRMCVEWEKDPHVLICPADGNVIDMAYDATKPFHGFAQKVSIFLSPFDVHVNWLPISGTIEKIVYTSGSFIPAFLPKSSEKNEHTDIWITDNSGRTIMVRQIAGFVARRICWWVHQGQRVHAGDKYGMIRFGSRVDIYMPAEIDIKVGLGQRVHGGQSVLGRWR